MRILLTGAAGFIGFHLANRLLQRGDTVFGLDNLNAYYEVALKQARLNLLKDQQRFNFVHVDMADRRAMEALFAKERFDAIVNLAAQAGVRHSLEHPHDYVESNVLGFMNVLEGARRQKSAHLVYASTSSVYGAGEKLPYREADDTDHP